MNLQELSRRAAAKEVDAVHLVSMEGDIYVLEALIGQRFHPIQDNLGHVLSVRSVEHARQLLSGLPKLPFQLVHAVVHDEMCGMQQEHETAEGVPMPLH
ncbi:DUF6482 family protein [Pseudomonas schmalbachii]|uniref:Cation transporter n=1 Tax=Pseudomonas schmalbachii TaxID=2816993 RepID=A0ABS3TW33_9PSED|nr:DUF6482 family protein [Pseudomonas schmalbachii]MBO3276779.1 hypothetical protein [Pseudomonas schmalbachii]